MEPPTSTAGRNGPGPTRSRRLPAAPVGKAPDRRRSKGRLRRGREPGRLAAQETLAVLPCVGEDRRCAGAEVPLDEAAAARHAAVLKALADPHRLRILSLLAAQPLSMPLCVCEIEGAFDLSQPTISHHLRVL